MIPALSRAAAASTEAGLPSSLVALMNTLPNPFPHDDTTPGPLFRLTFMFLPFLFEMVGPDWRQRIENGNLLRFDEDADRLNRRRQC
jgi:hypothetical protein